jgi:hypothetical protein
MKGRLLVFAAFAVYLIVVGCIVFPQGGSIAAPRGGFSNSANAGATDPADSDDFSADQPPRAADITGLPYRGIAMQVQQIGDVAPYERNIDEIADAGADTVSIVVDARQENGSSTMIFLDQRITPTFDQLVRLIKYAKGKNLRVLLMPIVLLQNPRGNEWRGTLKPESWEDWFVSYRELMKHFAMIAETGGADVLSVGSELVSTESKLEQWTRTIRIVRKIYRGKLTYSANWDAYAKTPFWNQLDLVGMNSYYTLGDDNRVSVQEIVTRWRAIQRDLLAFQKKTGRPILFMEAGWCSVSNAAHEPWDYTKTSLPVDVELQRKLYEGFFQTWHGQDGIGGFIIWEWPLGEGGLEDRGYTPENKPAEKVLRQWINKPWK